MEMDENPDDDLSGFRSPLPPEDRLWRHPSEMAGAPSPRPSRPVEPISWPRGERPLWTVCLASGLIGAVLTMGLVVASGGLGREVVEREVLERQQVLPALARASDAPSELDDVVAIAGRARPAIARLELELAEGRRGASGSGVLFRSNGYLLTNAHVVEDARSLRVVLANGREYEGKLIGADSETDVAVVKIEDQDLPTAVLGSAVDLHEGEPAVAIGSPLGLAGGPSVTVGVISALGRRIDDQGRHLHDMIQTDAPIAPGSSGGALLDRSGAVIGITTAIAVSEVGAEGLGFATPIDIARSVAEEIIATGRVVHVWIGIHGSDVDNETAESVGIEGGALVQEVMDESPADRAGMRPKDVIVELDGRRILTMSALVVALRRLDPGDRVDLSLIREGRRQTMTVTVAERPEPSDD